MLSQERAVIPIIEVTYEEGREQKQDPAGYQLLPHSLELCGVSGLSVDEDFRAVFPPDF